ncbi:hypothetical protein F4703DRAFT_1797943 [Phycomyces blakesleeanus]
MVYTNKKPQISTVGCFARLYSLGLESVTQSKCGGVGVGAGFKKENVTEIVGFNFGGAVELVLCGGVGVGTGFKKENVTVVVGFNFDSAVELVLIYFTEQNVGFNGHYTE